MSNPDLDIVVQLGPLALNATIVGTWLVMTVLVVGSWYVTRRMTSDVELSRGQNLLEVLVWYMNEQIREMSRQEPGVYLPFVGTLFFFIAAANLLTVIPGIDAPTGSISTTAALAFCVFMAVPLFGIGRHGLARYLKNYIQPSVFMLPFNVIGELTRTLALAVRLYGNIMSGTVIGAILLGLAPLFIPVLMQLLGLLTGVIQAYIFAILAMVYIASAAQAHERIEQRNQRPTQEPTS